MLPIVNRGEYPGVKTQDCLLAWDPEAKFSSKASGKKRAFHSILYHLLGFIRIDKLSLGCYEDGILITKQQLCPLNSDSRTVLVFLTEIPSIYPESPDLSKIKA